MHLFQQSLDSGGFFCISPQESLDCFKQKNQFIALNKKAGLYRKQGVVGKSRKQELETGYQK